MSNEFSLEVYYIKIRIKHTLKNYSENKENIIETIAIKNKDKITYSSDNTIYKLLLSKDKIVLIRDSEKFTHKFIFNLNNITNSEYYIKEFNTSINIQIKTIKLKINNQKIEIDYEIIDNDNHYSYILDME